LRVVRVPVVRPARFALRALARKFHVVLLDHDHFLPVAFFAVVRVGDFRAVAGRPVAVFVRVVLLVVFVRAVVFVRVVLFHAAPVVVRRALFVRAVFRPVAFFRVLRREVRVLFFGIVEGS
jgi:hypothetical protein